MRHEPSFHAHSIAYEVDADYVDGGSGCTCLLCRPHASLLSFVSRDNLNVAPGGHGLPPSHRFSRQRLTHHFTTLGHADNPYTAPPANDLLTLNRR